MNDIIITSNYPYLGHPSEHELNLPFWTALQQKYSNITIVTKTNKKFSKDTINGINYVQIPSSFGNLDYILKLTRWLAAQPTPRMVWSSDPAITPFATIPFAQSRKVPLLIELQNNFFSKLNNLELKLKIARRIAKRHAKKASAVRVCCNYHKMQLISEKYNENKIYAIPTRVDGMLFNPDIYDKARSRTCLGLHRDDNQISVLTIGNLVAAKGIHTAIQAIASTPENVHLFILGAGPLKEELEKLVLQLNVQNKVTWLYRVEHKQIPLLMSAMDIFVMPSRNEGMPRVINEAQAMKLPVIASKIDGIPEQLIDNHTGYLIDPGDHDTLSKLISRLSSDSNLRQRLGDAARRHVLEQFDFNTVMQKWFNLINLIVNE